MSSRVSREDGAVLFECVRGTRGERIEVHVLKPRVEPVARYGRGVTCGYRTLIANAVG